MKILVCNAGSSSLKFSLLEAGDESFPAEGSIASNKQLAQCRRRSAAWIVWYSLPA
jgi:acetate kinase